MTYAQIMHYDSIVHNSYLYYIIIRVYEFKKKKQLTKYIYIYVYVLYTMAIDNSILDYPPGKY